LLACAAQDLRTALQRHEAAAGPNSNFPVTLFCWAEIAKRPNELTMPQIFVKIKRHLYCVAPHFEIWAASQISEVMDFYRVRDAMLEIPANHRVGPSKAEIVTCSTCFIRCTSGSVLRTARRAVFAICT
jgi:hypothetical protein